MEEEKKSEDQIALKADKMIAKAGISIDPASDNENIGDVDEKDYNALFPAVTDQNGLPISMIHNN
jgi:hypothetical protein